MDFCRKRYSLGKYGMILIRMGEVKLQIRSFQLSDCADVTLLMEKSLTEACFHDTMEAFARQLSCDSRLVLVAENDSKVVGIVIGTIDNEDGYCYRIAVDPAFRRMGVGKSMVHELQNRFEQRKVKRVLVPLDTHNELTAHLYQALGFGIQHFTKSFKKLSIVTGA